VQKAGWVANARIDLAIVTPAERECGMKSTGERHIGGSGKSVEQAIADARHRFAYGLIREIVDTETAVLEVGFGEGYGPVALADDVSAYEGLEVDTEALDHVTAVPLQNNVSFRTYDGVSIPFADNSFDVVFALQVIEHVHQLELWLTELERVCRVRGTILFTTPNRTHRVMDGERPWNRFHLVEWTPQEFDELLTHQFVRVADGGGAVAGVSVTGISGTNEINEVELRRVNRLRRFARLDPLRLRERLPATWIHRLSGVLGSSADHTDGLEAEAVSIDSFHEHSENLADSLDLVGRIELS